MPTNDFQPFAAGGSANVISQSQYLTLSALSTGFQTGIAQSNQLNKVWRQSSIIAAMIAQFICDKSGQNAIDDGTIAALEFNFIAALQSVGRIKLTNALNLFVSPSGNDAANTGLSSASPFQTIQKAINIAYLNYDTQGNSITINLANGTYAGGVSIASTMLGNGNLNIVGNTSSPTSVVVSTTNAHAVFVSNGANVGVSGFTVAASGTVSGLGAAGLAANPGGVINILGSMNFSSCSGPHMWADGGNFNVLSSYTIAGGASAHMYSTYGGLILTGTGISVTLSGTPNYGGGFAAADHCGVMNVRATYTGSSTGPRYAVSSNGVIDAGSTVFPGSVAGATATGGQII